MKQLFTPFATFLFLALAACTDSSGYEIAKAPIVPAPPVIPLVPIVTDLAAVEVGIEKANLFAREPDTCHAADYQDLLGQNAQEIETREWKPAVSYRGSWGYCHPRICRKPHQFFAGYARFGLQNQLWLSYWGRGSAVSNPLAKLTFCNFFASLCRWRQHSKTLSVCGCVFGV
ncbi:MAG: hypothetical protein ABR89_07820 [Rhodobacter sp. BACL10 MAG-120910-bin24]|nr:MAG: hypothetical protein ABR89_07820 [Rhodobacter sp. BACL10 MAG-120910-bin24]